MKSIKDSSQRTETEKHVKKWSQFLQKAGKLGSFMDSFWASTETLIESEISYRAQRRAELLGVPESGKHHAKMEKQHHERSVMQLKRTIKLLKSARKKLDKVEEIEEDLVEMDKVRDQALASFQDLLLQMDMEPVTSLEVLDIYKERFEKAKEKGVKALLDDAEEQLEELVRVRSKEPNRGRDEKRSPILWWKKVMIGGGLCMSAWSVFQCIIQEACKSLILIGGATLAWIYYSLHWC
ncbi:MAG: hypothetical protein ACFFER_06485 [Candidatus Thorarchaeota archaeon]